VPNALNLRTLHQHSDLSNPMREASNYPEKFNASVTAPVTVH
jgi:catalase (peroxidase I)